MRRAKRSPTTAAVDGFHSLYARSRWEMRICKEPRARLPTSNCACTISRLHIHPSRLAMTHSAVCFECAASRRVNKGSEAHGPTQRTSRLPRESTSGRTSLLRRRSSGFGPWQTFPLASASLNYSQERQSTLGLQRLLASYSSLNPDPASNRNLISFCSLCKKKHMRGF